MYKIIQADGVTIGKSERFAIPPLINKARAVTTVNQDGVMIWTEANAELSEMSGGGGRKIQRSLLPGRICADA